MRHGCVFCQIVDGALDAAVVLRDEIAVAFLDRAPVFKGHVLVVPTTHAETLADLPADPALLGTFLLRVQRVTCAVEHACDAHGTWASLNNRVSQSVAHLHVHIVPRRRKDGLRGFYWPRQKYADHVEIDEYATRIRDALNGE